MTIDEIISRLDKVKKSGNGYTALCRAHDDKSPSLSISPGSDGKILVKCFAGCSPISILNAIGLAMKDLFPDDPVIRLYGNGSKAPASKAASTTKAQSKDDYDPFRDNVIETIYEYTDERGEVLYENVRFNSPKDFRPRKPDGKGGYIKTLGAVRRVPYRLPEMIHAVKNGIDEIWLTEGEKDADNLRLLGLTATSFKSWTQSLNPHIKGAHAVLFRDHDKAGVKQANDAARIIAKAAKSVKLIDLFNAEPMPDKHGQDVSDWIEALRSEGLDANTTAERLAVIVNGSGYWQDAPDTAPTANDKGRFQFNFTTLDDMYREPEEDTAYVWDRTFPVGGFSIISAKPKVGKSTVLRNLAVAISRGEPFLGRDTVKGKVLYLCLEEKRNEVRKHFEVMLADGDMILIHTGGGARTTRETIEALGAAIAEFEPVIVFVDPLSRVLRQVDFNDYRITYALEPFIDLARRTNVHLSASHHDGKSERDGGDAILGSTALFGSVDCHISMKKRKDGRTISSTQRYGDDLPETIIELDKATGLIIDKGDLQTAILAEIKGEVLGVIGSEWLKQADIKERLPNRNGGQISKAINSLLTERILDRVGTGKRNDPYYYGKEQLKEVGAHHATSGFQTSTFLGI